MINLSLAGNNIQTVDWTLLPMQTLKRLDLSGNHLTEIPGYQNVALTEQRDFAGVWRMMPSTDGAVNRWKDVPSTVERVNLGGNRIANVKETFKYFPNLTVFDLGYNRIEVLPSGFLQGFGQLRSVNLSGNELKNLSEGVFVGLPQLNDVDLSFNKLTVS